MAELADPPQEAGRLHDDPRGSLDERLDDDRSHLGAVGIEDALERDNFLDAEGARAFGIVDKVIEKRLMLSDSK